MVASLGAGISFSVNGQKHNLDPGLQPCTTLFDFLRGRTTYTVISRPQRWHKLQLLCIKTCRCPLDHSACRTILAAELLDILHSVGGLSPPNSFYHREPRAVVVKEAVGHAVLRYINTIQLQVRSTKISHHMALAIACPTLIVILTLAP